MADADVTRLNDDKRLQQAFALFFHNLSDTLNQGLASIAREADQDDA